MVWYLYLSESPDSYLCARDGRLLQTVIGQKKTEILYSEGGTKEIAVSPERQKEPALKKEEILALCTQAIQIEEHYHCPMDIEWAICNGRIFILQARAITTLKPDTSDPKEERQIGQYLKRCKASGILKKDLAFLLEKIPDAFYPFDSHMTAAVNQVSAVFSQIGIGISRQPEIDDDGVETLPPNKKTITRKIFHLPKTIREWRNFSYGEQRLRRQMRDFAEELEEIRALPTNDLDLFACGQEIWEIRDYVGRLAYSRFYYAIFSAHFASSYCERAARKINPNYASFDFLKNLDNRTAEFARDIQALAEWINQDDRLVKAINDGGNYASVCADLPQAVPAFQALLDKHGYSSDYNCYCLHAKSFWEEPDRLIHILRPLLSVEQRQADPDSHSAIMHQMKEHMSEKKYTKLEKAVESSRSFHKMRESSQYMWETAFYFMRKTLTRAAFLSTGDENYFHNLAWLFPDEVIAMCHRGGLDGADREKMKRRKEKRPFAEKVWEQAKLMVFTEKGGAMKGISGSFGQAVGRACIIRSPREFYKLKKGDVLICPLTDPEWTPLFTLACAVVADTGAALSHAAIVAREYGIPAVLGVGFATEHFQDGDMILVDGTKGRVSRVGEGDR